MSIRRILSLSFPRAAERIGFTALLLVATAAIACGGSDEPAPTASPESAGGEPRTIGAPSGSSPTADIAREAEEQVEILQGTLPEGFPSDIPRYPGAKADNALSLPGTSLVAFSSDESPETILDFYRSELQTQGWSVREGAAGVEASKGGRQVQIQADATDTGSAFALTITGG